MLSLSESAKIFGLSQRTLRRAIQNGDLAFTIVQGRYKLQFADLLQWSEQSPRTRQKRDSEGIGQYVASWKTDISNNPVVELIGKLTVTEQPLSFKRTPRKIAQPESNEQSKDPVLNWD